jgi:hypothetical protein
MGQHGDAVRCFELALTLRRGSAARPGASDSASSSSAAEARLPPADTEHDLMSAAARALYAHGAKDAGSSLVMRVLRESEEKHPGALFEYAKISLDQGRPPDAVAVLLRLLAAAPSRSDVKTQLAATAAAPGGVQAVMAALDASGTGLASAVAFVAAAVKEGGAVEAAAALCGRAAALAPSSAAHALARCHALEACGRPGAALDALASFFAANASLRIGGDAPSGQEGLALGDLAPLLRDLPRLPGDARAGAAGTEWYISDASRNASLDAEHALPPPDAAAAAAACSGEAHGSVSFAPAALDALACVFSAVKLLYALGAVSRASLAAALAEEARALSAVPLHTTPIRNEAAYFACVAALLRGYPLPAPPDAAADAADAALTPVYLLGDSHVLSGAWRRVALPGGDAPGAPGAPGARALLVPALVTGVKAWHLRPGCRFYPAAHWAATAARLPDGARVVALVGEIDCREGILAGVARGRYGSIAEGAAHTASIYIDALRGLISRRGFTVYVHPVPPVLDVTRRVVLAYNAALRDAVRAANAGAGGGASGGKKVPPGKLRWLEFGDALLAPGGGALKAELSLDGTHLAPPYVALLSDALAAAS